MGRRFCVAAAAGGRARAAAPDLLYCAGVAGAVGRHGRRRAGRLLLLELLALLFRAELKLLLQLLVLLLEHLGIDRRAVERRAEVLHRQIEGHLDVRLVADDDAGDLRLLEVADRLRVEVGFGEAAVREADRELAVDRLALVDHQPEAGTQQQADRQQEAGDAAILVGHLIDGDRQRRRLVGGLAEIAGGVADLLARSPGPCRRSWSMGPASASGRASPGRTARRLARPAPPGRRARPGPPSRSASGRRLRRLRHGAARRQDRRSGQHQGAAAFEREGHELSFRSVISSTRPRSARRCVPCRVIAAIKGRAPAFAPSAPSFHIRNDNPTEISLAAAEGDDLWQARRAVTGRRRLPKMRAMRFLGILVALTALAGAARGQDAGGRRHRHARRAGAGRRISTTCPTPIPTPPRAAGSRSPISAPSTASTPITSRPCRRRRAWSATSTNR